MGDQARAEHKALLKGMRCGGWGQSGRRKRSCLSFLPITFLLCSKLSPARLVYKIILTKSRSRWLEADSTDEDEGLGNDSENLQHFPHLVVKREADTAVLHVKDGAWLGRGRFQPGHTFEATLGPTDNSAP